MRRVEALRAIMEASPGRQNRGRLVAAAHVLDPQRHVDAVSVNCLINATLNATALLGSIFCRSALRASRLSCFAAKAMSLHDPGELGRVLDPSGVGMVERGRWRDGRHFVRDVVDLVADLLHDVAELVELVGRLVRVVVVYRLVRLVGRGAALVGGTA